MQILDMTHNYWLYFKENYVQKDSENEKNRLRNDGKTSNDGDASTSINKEHSTQKLETVSN